MRRDLFNFAFAMSKSRYTVEDLRRAVAESVSVAGVLRQLGLRPVGGNYRTIDYPIFNYFVRIVTP